MTPGTPAQFAIYFGVIVISTGADVACVLVLRGPLPLLLAVMTGFLANVLSGYALSRRFVFTRGTRSHVHASWRFVVLVAINVVVGVGGVTSLVVLGAPYVLARVVSSGLLVPMNFVVMRSWVFRERVSTA